MRTVGVKGWNGAIDWLICWLTDRWSIVGAALSTTDNDWLWFDVQTGALLRAAHEGDIDKVSALLQEGVPVDSSNSVRMQCVIVVWFCLFETFVLSTDY